MIFVNNVDNFELISKKINNSYIDLKDYIVKRLLKLEKETVPMELGFNSYGKIESVYNGYISSNSPIKASKSAEAFYLDNINIYYDFIIQYKNHINEEDLLKMFQDLQEYFTETFGLIGSEKKRREVYCTHSKELKEKITDKELLSIHKLTEKGAAMCLERSAILQNILSLLGLNSYFIYGKLEKVVSNDNIIKELHSYNIVKITKDDYMLYDISNPVSLEFEGIKKYFPAINILNYEQLKYVINGQKYLFDNKQIENLFDCKAVVLNEVKRIYTIG